MRRLRFFANLAALTAGLVLLVAAGGFPPGALLGIGLGAGTVGLVVSLVYSAVLVHQRPLEGGLEFGVFGWTVSVWRVLSAAISAVASWEIIAVTTFAESVSRWLTLANGIVVALLGAGGLIAHEHCSERIIHVLEIVERPRHDAV